MFCIIVITYCRLEIYFIHYWNNHCCDLWFQSECDVTRKILADPAVMSLSHTEHCGADCSVPAAVGAGLRQSAVAWIVGTSGALAASIATITCVGPAGSGCTVLQLPALSQWSLLHGDNSSSSSVGERWTAHLLSFPLGLQQTSPSSSQLSCYVWRLDWAGEVGWGGRVPPDRESGPRGRQGRAEQPSAGRWSSSASSASSWALSPWPYPTGVTSGPRVQVASSLAELTQRITIITILSYIHKMKWHN